MDAIVIAKFGGPEVLSLQEVDKPEPGPGELLVKVHACGINPVDAKIRKGGLSLPFSFPLILGYDVSGVVEAAGEGVEDYKPGDAVFYSPELTRPGAYAEYHVVPERLAALKPDGLTHLEAASLPIAACTAWQALFDRAGVQSGDVVLIHGGAGGVGSMAVQLASWAGCEVIVTAGRENRSFVEEMGADLVIDYNNSDFVARVLEATDGDGADVVLDTVGGDVFIRSFGAVAANGTVVSIVSETFADQPLSSLRPAFFKNADACFHFFQRDRATLDDVARLVERGFVEPVVDEVVGFGEVARAHERMQSGHGRGKVVLEIVEEG